MKTAVVTGASRGIGRAVAAGLAEDGYSLALSARGREDLERARDDILSSSPSVEVAVYPVDLKDSRNVSDMVDDVVKRFGRIDLLFNNAGIFHGGTVDLPFEQFEEMIDINLKAAFRVLQKTVPVMRKQKSGRIINLSSRSGKIAKPTSGAYAASKFGLVGLSEALYREVTADGIRVTALCPGWVDTDMAAMSGLPPEEMVQTADIVATVRWLANLSPAACVKDLVIESFRQV